MKKTLSILLAAALLPLGGAVAAAAEPAPRDAKAPRELGVESSIVFPSDSSIRNWRADRDRGIWIQDRRGDWYYGTFAGFCRDLDFAQVIGVDTRGISRLDRFATIIVRGERCQLSSFVTSAPPPSKKDKAAARKAAEAAKEN